MGRANSSISLAVIAVPTGFSKNIARRVSCLVSFITSLK